MDDSGRRARPWWDRRQTGAAGSGGIGQPPETRKQALVKLAWVGIWLVYLSAPVSDLTGGRHSAPVTVAAVAGLAGFVAGYLALVFFRASAAAGERPQLWVYELLAVLTALAVALSVALGEDWLVLFVYVSVACGAALPARESRWAVPGTTLTLVAVGTAVAPATGGGLYAGLVIPGLLGGFAMVGVQQLILTMRELRAARESVAQLAATEERLRLARDLHDLLGHSLSLITLKSELAGRMLPDRPQDAASQVADIEKVSRQALVDVREAVSGYRRPTLAAEAAGARTALASAGISARVHVPDRVPGLTPDGEGALAWALREAVTNAVRHSGASTCVVALTTSPGRARLTVSDDGRGPCAGHVPGNGLTGLSERLLLAGGSLETARSGDGGFALTAAVPLGPAAGTAQVGARLREPGE